MAISKNVAILGAGALGMALAYHLANLGLNVVVYDKNTERLEGIMSMGALPMHPALQMPNNIRQAKTFSEIGKNSLYLLAVPSRSIVPVLLENGTFLDKDALYVICSKGIDKSGLLLSQIVSQYLPGENIGVLAGPNFAKDIVHGELTVSNIAFCKMEVASTTAKMISGGNLLAKPIDDLVTIQLCGAYKNVLAVAVGILKGLGHLPNALAALICYGIDELRTLIKAFSGKEQTLLEPCGFGDIYLTCGNEDSRNMSFGMLLAEGGDIGAHMLNHTVEGIEAMMSFHKIAQSKAIALPIVNLLHDIVVRGIAPSNMTKFFR